MKKPIIRSFDFIRAVSTFGMVLFHFSFYQPEGSFRPLYMHANSYWGSALVTVFFMLSGASLYYHYDSPMDAKALRAYCYKRWKSIFPMYYLAYILVEIQKMIASGSAFFRGNPLQYVFTLIGMDGYLAQTFPTAYNLGEWFIGAIVLLYILYPLVMYIFNRNAPISFAAILLLYLLTRNIAIINPEPFRTIPSCLASFACGMFLIKYRDLLKDVRLAIVSALGLLVLCFVRLPIPENLCDHLAGVFLFVVLDFIGERLTRLPGPAALFSFLSSISYAVFLVHHVTLSSVLDIWHPTDGISLAFLLALLFFLIIAFAVLLAWAAKKLTRFIDSVLLRKSTQR